MMIEPSGTSFDLLAAYGAILATISFLMSSILAIREIRKDRRFLRVISEIGFVTSSGSVVSGIQKLSDVPPDMDTSRKLVMISVVNKGRPTQITTAYFKLTSGSKLASLEPTKELPRKLDRNERWGTFFELREIETAMQELRRKDSSLYVTAAIIEDAEGNKYYGELPYLLKQIELAR